MDSGENFLFDKGSVRKIAVVGGYDAACGPRIHEGVDSAPGIGKAEAEILPNAHLEL
jgi:hypothetical protein